MANTENKASKTTEETKGNRVEIFVPRGHSGEDPNKIIGVNGVLYSLPRGKKSSVPDFVAEEYYRGLRAEEKQAANIDQMLEASK